MSGKNSVKMAMRILALAGALLLAAAFVCAGSPVDETSGAARPLDPAWLQLAEAETLQWWDEVTRNASARRHEEQVLLAAAPASASFSAGGDHSSSKKSTNQAITKKRPNFVFVIVDDMDKEMGSLEFMPKTKKLLRDQGTEFTNHFVTASVCCPSRMSVLTGMFAHNTNFTDVVAPGGGWERYFDLGLTDISLPKFLHDAGYSTAESIFELINQD